MTNLRDIHLNPQKAYEPETKGEPLFHAGADMYGVGDPVHCLDQLYQYDGCPLDGTGQRDRHSKGFGGEPPANRGAVPVRIVDNEQDCLYPGYRVDGGVDACFNNLTGRDLGFSVWVTTSLGWMLLLIFALGVFLSGFYPATIFVRH